MHANVWFTINKLFQYVILKIDYYDSRCITFVTFNFWGIQFIIIKTLESLYDNGYLEQKLWDNSILHVIFNYKYIHVIVRSTSMQGTRVAQ